MCVISPLKIFTVLCLYPASIAKDVILSVSPKIFSLYDDQLHHVQHWDTFIGCGYDQSDIKYVSEKELEAFPLGPPFVRSENLNPLLKVDNDAHFYIFTSGCRQHLAANEIGHFGYSTSHTNYVSSEDVQPFQVTRFSTDCDNISIVCCNRLLNREDLHPVIKGYADSNIYIIRNNMSMIDISGFPLTYREPGEIGPNKLSWLLILFTRKMWPRHKNCGDTIVSERA